MSPEEWRPILGWEGFYEVSDLGRVRSLDRVVARSDGRSSRLNGRVLVQGWSAGGYPTVHLANGARKVHRKVHQIVAETFLGPRPDGLMICHNDGDPKNNAVPNLRYDTGRANALDRVLHGRNHFANQTHCKRGHEFTEANTRRRPAGRSCKTCERLRKGRHTPIRRSAA